MLEIMANRARPMAASHAANTNIVIGIVNIIIDCELSVVRVAVINSVSIMPSRHRRVDMRWDRKMRVPRKENRKASSMLVVVGVILVIMVRAMF